MGRGDAKKSIAAKEGVIVALRSAKEDRQRMLIEKGEKEFRDAEGKLEEDAWVSFKKLEKRARTEEEENKAKKSGVRTRVRMAEGKVGGRRSLVIDLIVWIVLDPNWNQLKCL